MVSQTKLKKALKNLAETEVAIKSKPKVSDSKTVQLGDYKANQKKQEDSVKHTQASSLKKEVNTEKSKDKKQASLTQEVGIEMVSLTTEEIQQGKDNTEKVVSSVKNPSQKKKDFTIKKEKKTEAGYQEGDMLKAVEARRIQMMTQSEMERAPSSPLQMHLVQSESLRIAQDKISDLEEELHEFRRKNESLVAASETLKEKNDLLKSKSEDLKYSLKEEKGNSKDEKEILLSAIEEAKTQLNQLKSKKQELERRLSSDLHGIRNRESSLESRIEILKMENSVLQREKDKKIIELKKQTQKIKSNLDGAHKKNQDLQTQNNKLQESSRRTVSALRATIYNLEGVRAKEETIVTEIDEKK